MSTILRRYFSKKLPMGEEQDLRVIDQELDLFIDVLF